MIEMLNIFGNDESVDFVTSNIEKYIKPSSEGEEGEIDGIAACRLEKVLQSQQLQVSNVNLFARALIGYVRRKMKRLCNESEESVMKRILGYVSIEKLEMETKRELADAFLELYLDSNNSLKDDVCVDQMIFRKLVEQLKISNVVREINLNEKFRSEIKFRASGKVSGEPENLLDISSDSKFKSNNNNSNSWVEFEFPVEVSITKYQARAVGGGSTDPCNWAVEMLSENGEWIPIDTQKNSSAFKNLYKGIRSFEVSKNDVFGKRVRVKTIGPNANGYIYFTHFVGIVYYGILKY